jgi:chemotaxis protein MotB
MALDENRPIIIKKIKKGGHGHHGGAWKIAYADFVTAMMAFFLLMWLLGSTTEAQKKGIADYFQNPMKVSLSGGETSGDTTSILKGGGPDLIQDSGQFNMGDVETLDDVRRAGQSDLELLEALNRSLREAIETSPLLSEFRDQLKIDFTRDGLRIQLVDAKNRPMFDLGSARMEPHAERILNQITPLIAQLPNKVSIIGHTDATAYVRNDRDYSNWELSADRANAARRQMLRSGLPEDHVVRSSGMAAVVPFDAQDPRAPVNRRIAIIVLNKRAEEALAAEYGGQLSSGPEGVRFIPISAPAAPQ